MLYLSLLKNQLVRAALVLLLGMGVGYVLHRHFNPKETVFLPGIPTIKTVVVEKPVLDTRIVDRIISDPTERKLVEKLIGENQQLSLKVTELTSTVALLNSTGGTSFGGTITPPPSPTVRLGDTTLSPSSPPPQVEAVYQFKDWQLEAKYSTKAFDYVLSQKFTVVSTVGKDKNGQRQSIIRVYQVGKDGQPLLVPSTSTVVLANENVARFRWNPRIQGGIGVGQDGKSGFVSVSFISRGTSKAAEDTRLAVANIGLRVGGVGSALDRLVLQPLTYNLGTLPRNPLSNIWLGPTINRNKQVGIALTASF